MENKRVGLLGATSLVGECLLPLMAQSGWRVAAFSRQQINNNSNNVEWHQLGSVCTNSGQKSEEGIAIWICAVPIWVLPDYFSLLKSHGAKRVVAISSTSRYTKEGSSDLSEQNVAHMLVDAEARLQNWAEENDIEWIIIQPTLIYGLGKDKNIAEITRLIKRWKFFPLLGKGSGARQPIHAEDVAKCCQLAAMVNCKNKSYTISGGETLSYKEMVKRVFIAVGEQPHFIHLPRWCFKLMLIALRLLPRFRKWSVTMVDRMEQDLVFDNKNAITDFGYVPRLFFLEKRDIF